MSKFISTRNKNLMVDSKKAIIDGLANDGGLYLPLEIKKIKDLKDLKNLSYQALALEIISNVFDDLSKPELKKVIDEAYSDNFSAKEITPVKKVNDKYLLDLTCGPTSAFKDIALQFLPRIMKMLNDDEKDIVIITATSGDTGKAALEGFKDVDGTKIKVLYPYKMVSTIQERQMSTTDGNNTEVVAVKGNFDDCQRMVKDILENEKFENIHLSSANSINIARLIPQCVYYFKAYFELLNSGEIGEDEKVDFVVPTGNFGDILAGYLAKEMGLPVNKLVIASNQNKVLTDFFKTGNYSSDRTLYNTMSPSIDILVSSNLERLLYLLSQDDKLVGELMKSLKEQKNYQVDDELLKKLQDSFLAYYTSEEECKETIKEYYTKHHCLVDPHTAIALAASEKYQTAGKQIILATASPFKFAKDVYYCLTDEKIEDNLAAMDILSAYTKEVVPLGLAKLKSLPIIHDEVIEKDAKEIMIEKLRNC